MLIETKEANDWRRVGGKRKQFYVIDEEISNILNHKLPKKFEPYFLVVPYQVKINKREYIEQADIIDLSDFLSKREEGFWDFFLASDVLSPGLRNLATGGDISAMCSYNGLINIQQGAVKNNGIHLRSSLSVVDKVKNIITGEIRNHRYYFKIYKEMFEQLSNYLLYETIREFKDGTSDVLKDELMSTGAKDLYDRGQIIYFIKPGNKI